MRVPTSLKRCLAILMARTVGLDQKATARHTRCADQTVVLVEKWAREADYTAVVLLCDEQTMKHMVSKEMSFWELDNDTLLKLDRITGDDILQHYRKDYMEHKATPARGLTEWEQQEFEKHANYVRDLARSWAYQHRLPNISSLFIEDLGGSGRHSKGIFDDQGESKLAWGVSHDGREVRLLCPIEVDSEVEAIFRELQDHLANSEFSGTLQILERRRVSGGEILALCNKLYHLVVQEIHEKIGGTLRYRADRKDYGIEEHAFTLSICVDEVNRASGFNLYSNLKYDRMKLDDKAYVLLFGSYPIALESSEQELNKYEEAHRETRTKHPGHDIAKRIYRLTKELDELDNKVFEELDSITRVIVLPGYCNTCKSVRRI